MAENKNKSEAVLTDEQREQLLDDFLNKCGTLKDLRGISDESMEAIYAVAYHLYAAGNFKRALSLFEFLCFYDHFERKYWMALGACRQMLKQYKAAIGCYAYAAMLDVDDPQPHFNAGDCYMALGEKNPAKMAFQAVLSAANKDQKYKTMRERAQSLLDMMNAK